MQQIVRSMLLRKCCGRLGSWYASRSLSLSSHSDHAPQFCIVGSGPAGFYTAQQILKVFPAANVDLIERLPVPFGLVRYGVAPDHPEVKNVINTFTRVADNPRFSFYGNVEVGKDVTLDQLRSLYHGVILAYGAENNKELSLAGSKDCRQVLSARAFVEWYNGLPSAQHLPVDLSCEDVVVVGVGNVALDVARILLSPTELLSATDITQDAQDMLENSKVKRVTLIGRRGPLQVAFTIKELREMTKLPGVSCNFTGFDLSSLKPDLQSLPRARRRLTELMVKQAESTAPPALPHPDRKHSGCEFRVQFLSSPDKLEFDDNKNLVALHVRHNKLVGDDPETQECVATDETQRLNCGLLLTSIGYQGESIDNSLPFDVKRGIIPNHQGKVDDAEGLYCSGWIKRGPTGVILTTTNDAVETAHTISEDVASGRLDISNSRDGGAALAPMLCEKGVQIVSFERWKKIDEYEKFVGAGVGRPRCKLLTKEEMLEVAFPPL